MTGEQVYEARLLLSWTLAELAVHADLSRHVIRAYEVNGRMPASMFRRTSPADRCAKLRAALEAAGIEFIEQTGGGLGVHLRDQVTPA